MGRGFQSGRAAELARREGISFREACRRLGRAGSRVRERNRAERERRERDLRRFRELPYVD